MSDTAVADDGNNDNEMAVLNEAARIVDGAQDDLNLEAIFTVANKVGAYLLVWRNMMVNGITGDENSEGFSGAWVEDAAMDLFHKFFHPWEPTNDNGIEYHHFEIGNDD